MRKNPSNEKSPFEQLLDQFVGWVDPDDPIALRRDVASEIIENAVPAGANEDDHIWARLAIILARHVPVRRMRCDRADELQVIKLALVIADMIKFMVHGPNDIDRGPRSGTGEITADNGSPPMPPPEARDDWTDRWVQHFSIFQTRCRGKPIGVADVLREWVGALIVLLCWYRKWRAPLDGWEVGMQVHECYTLYRATVDDPGPLALPCEEDMSCSKAISHLDALLVRLTDLTRHSPGDDPFFTGRWFGKNTPLKPTNLRSAVRQGKAIRTAGTGAQKTYSFNDARRIWPDRLPERPPKNPK